jgi:5-methylcytosine-specific restriction endonuclease McrA
VQLSCATCSTTFTIAATRVATAKYCSVACRAAQGRVVFTCRRCGEQSSIEKADAENKIFCSRKCMFAEWGCAWCSKLIPAPRRDAGHAHCSDRCELSADLAQEHQQTGVLRAWCPSCEQVLPADSFTKEKANRNGLAYRCKSCQRGQYENNKIEYRRRRFGYKAAESARTLPFTQEQQDARWAMWGGRCWICGVADATEEDHVKPLSAGGWHCLANLRPACKPCNASKHGDWPLPQPALRPNFRHPSPRPGSDAQERTPRLPRQEHTCEHCGTVRMVRACDARKIRYCSKACQYAAQTQPRVAITCIGCGTTVDLPGHTASQQRKFCSTSCAYDSGKRGKGGQRKAAPGDGQTSLF